MRSMLDKAGFQKVWTAVKNKFVAKVAGKDLSSNDYTDAEQAALNSLGGGNFANVPFLAQLAALFTGDTDSVIQDAPDDATLDTLTDGIWRISVAARQSIGTPADNYGSYPPQEQTTARYSGGLLLLTTINNIEQHVSSYLKNADTGQTLSQTYITDCQPVRMALYIAPSYPSIWWCTKKCTLINRYITGGAETSRDHTYNWHKWHFLGASYSATTLGFTSAPAARGTITISSAVTASADTPLLVFPVTSRPFPLTMSSGYLIGPACATLKQITNFGGNLSVGSLGTNAGTNTAVVATSGTFPAGTYYYEVYTTQFAT